MSRCLLVVRLIDEQMCISDRHWPRAVSTRTRSCLRSARANSKPSQPGGTDDRGVLLTRIAELQGVVQNLRSECPPFCIGFGGLVAVGVYARMRVLITAAYTSSPGRSRRAKRVYDEEVDNELESSPAYGRSRHVQNLESGPSSMDTSDKDRTVVRRTDYDSSPVAAGVATPASRSTDIVLMDTTADLQARESIDRSTQPAGSTCSAPSTAASMVVATNASAVTTSSRAYDARFARDAVCICADRPPVHAAVNQLIAAVRDAAAVVTQLHSEEVVTHQCALLSRMFDFDGFLW